MWFYARQNLARGSMILRQHLERILFTMHRIQDPNFFYEMDGILDDSAYVGAPSLYRISGWVSSSGHVYEYFERCTALDQCRCVLVGKGVGHAGIANSYDLANLNVWRRHNSSPCSVIKKK